MGDLSGFWDEITFRETRDTGLPLACLLIDFFLAPAASCLRWPGMPPLI
jgi:hypothetical protein